jgi:hypothetical protein
MIARSLLMIGSFTRDYFVFIYSQSGEAWTPISGHNLFSEFIQYIPQTFTWSMFIAGDLLIIIAIYFMMKRFRTSADIFQAK